MAFRSSTLCVVCALAVLICVSSVHASAIPPDTALAIRFDSDANGKVAEWFDQADMIQKRWVAALGVLLLTNSLAFTAMTCTIPLVWPPAGPACIASLIGVGVGNLVAIVGYAIDNLKKRDTPLQLHAGGIPVVENDNFLEEYEATGKPVLLRWHDCYEGCYQAEYSRRISPAGREVHHIRAGPRRVNNGTNHFELLKERDSYYYVDNTYIAGGYPAEDELYFDYDFNLVDVDAAKVWDDYGTTYGNFKEAMEEVSGASYIWNTGQGYYCYNYFTPGYGSKQVTGGYAAIFQGGEENVAGDVQDDYLETCEGGETGYYYTGNYN